jgi:hypothetical protein
MRRSLLPPFWIWLKIVEPYLRRLWLRISSWKKVMISLCRKLAVHVCCSSRSQLILRYMIQSRVRLSKRLRHLLRRCLPYHEPQDANGLSSKDERHGTRLHHVPRKRAVQIDRARAAELLFRCIANKNPEN